MKKKDRKCCFVLKMQRFIIRMLTAAPTSGQLELETDGNQNEKFQKDLCKQHFSKTKPVARAEKREKVPASSQQPAKATKASSRKIVDIKKNAPLTTKCCSSILSITNDSLHL